MHIVDGALSSEVVVGASLLCAGGLVVGLRKLDMELIPAAGVLSATFFVASLIHVPLGVSSVHLIMNGLAGIILGWTAFPALFIALLLQAVFFAFGGITVLGVNTLNIAGPAVIVGLIGPSVSARDEICNDLCHHWRHCWRGSHCSDHNLRCLFSGLFRRQFYRRSKARLLCAYPDHDHRGASVCRRDVSDLPCEAGVAPCNGTEGVT